MTQNEINLLIVDDHPIIRDGLRNMLESQTEQGTYKVFEAENEEQAIKVVKNNKLDCVIMDFQLPDKKGHEITKTLIGLVPDLKVLGLSNYDEYAYALEMLKAGAQGYVLKNVSIKELVFALNQIMNGNVYYCNDIANKLINYKLKELLNNEPRILLAKAKAEASILTQREIQIVELISQEFTNEDISFELGLSKRTVDNHRQNILNKLRLKNTAGLVRYAFQNGLLT